MKMTLQPLEVKHHLLIFEFCGLHDCWVPVSESFYCIKQ
uniref:Uncharacterized protein n=1 Tax=Rhizophora mucronata TaxID=61149 RepID=A0A2P2NVR7_RHIMU